LRQNTFCLLNRLPQDRQSNRQGQAEKANEVNTKPAQINRVHAKASPVRRVELGNSFITKSGFVTG
jgi:hypothetical protein